MGRPKKKDSTFEHSASFSPSSCSPTSVGLLCIGSLALLVGLFCAKGTPLDEDWVDLVTWMRTNGADVHRSLRTNLVWHGGFQMRGLTTDSELKRGTTILRVPRALWLSTENLPEPPRAQPDECRGTAEDCLAGLQECQEVDRASVVFAVVMMP